MNTPKYNIALPEEVYCLLEHEALISKSSIDEVLADIIQEYLGDGDWDRPEPDFESEWDD